MSNIKYVILGICFLIFSCKKDVRHSIKNLNQNDISAFGHGGMGISSLYPMNSLEGILESLTLGAAGTEIDIQISSDGIIVGYHDESLTQQTDLFGVINDWSWHEIAKINYVRQPYSRYKIVSLDTIFSNIPNLHSYIFTFDCKLYNNAANHQIFLETFADAIAEIIEKHQLEENVFIESQDRHFLAMLKEKMPHAKLFIYPPSFYDGLEIAKSLDLFGITISTELINREQVDLAHAQGIRIALFNIHSQKSNRRGIEKSPDFIQSDNLEHLLKILK